MHINKNGIRIHDKSSFTGMRNAGSLAASILDTIGELVVPGKSTEEIDIAINKIIEKANAKSATIGYRGYKHASCISLNHVVCHGIPSTKIIKNGDIINIDVTVIVDG